MLDPKQLRADLPAVAAGLARRGYVLDTDAVIALEARRKAIQTETETLQAERNRRSKDIGLVKKQGGDIAPVMAEMEQLKTRLQAAEGTLAEIQAEFDDFSAALPNIPQTDVPDGASEDDNLEVRRWGTVVDEEAAPDHVTLGEADGLMDFAAGAKLTGARFTVLRVSSHAFTASWCSSCSIFTPPSMATKSCTCRTSSTAIHCAAPASCPSSRPTCSSWRVTRAGT